MLWCTLRFTRGAPEAMAEGAKLEVLTQALCVRTMCVICVFVPLYGRGAD